MGTNFRCNNINYKKILKKESRGNKKYIINSFTKNGTIKRQKRNKNKKCLIN